MFRFDKLAHTFGLEPSSSELRNAAALLMGY